MEKAIQQKQPTNEQTSIRNQQTNKQSKSYKQTNKQTNKQITTHAGYQQIIIEIIAQGNSNSSIAYQ